MELKIRKQNSDGVARMETCGEIKEVIINEDLLHPDKESISICFRGKNTSGILDLTPNEVDRLFNSVRKRMHLIKGFKEIKGGAIMI